MRRQARPALRPHGSQPEWPTAFWSTSVQSAGHVELAADENRCDAKARRVTLLNVSPVTHAGTAIIAKRPILRCRVRLMVLCCLDRDGDGIGRAHSAGPEPHGVICVTRSGRWYRVPIRATTGPGRRERPDSPRRLSRTQRLGHLMGLGDAADHSSRPGTRPSGSVRALPVESRSTQPDAPGLAS